VLIFAYFKPHILGIRAFIESLGINTAVVFGENTPIQTDEAIKNFRSGKVSVLIGNPASMGHGITLTEKHVVVWFTPIWNLEIFEQARQRVHRIGLKHKTYEIFLQAEDTIEEDIYIALKEKKSLAKVILDSIENRTKKKGD
jgi:SNF2 family DNA or RNA helicase